MRVSPWALSLLFGWYTLYSSWTLYLPAWFPDLWPTTGGAVLMVTLIAGITYKVSAAYYPRLSADGSDPARSTAEAGLVVPSV